MALLAGHEGRAPAAPGAAPAAAADAAQQGAVLELDLVLGVQLGDRELVFAESPIALRSARSCARAAAAAVGKLLPRATSCGLEPPEDDDDDEDEEGSITEALYVAPPSHCACIASVSSPFRPDEWPPK